MRLRYINLPDLPPLQNISIQFQHEQILGRECAIRFVVGVNGSGKTRLMRALAEIFLNLERGSRLALPFPVALAYDIGVGDERHTIYLNYPGHADGAEFRVFSQTVPLHVDWASVARDKLPAHDEFLGGDLPTSSSMVAHLPEVMVIYTSGNPELWGHLFQSDEGEVDFSFGDTLLESTEERPVGWDIYRELQLQEEPEGLAPESPELVVAEPTESTRIGYFVSGGDLTLAVCAVTLTQAIDDIEATQLTEARAAFINDIKEHIHNQVSMPSLRGLLNEVGWLWPTTVGLHIDFDVERFARLSRPEREQIGELYRTATTVIKGPEPSIRRLLLYDLRQPSEGEGPKSTAQGLAEVLSRQDQAPTAFDVYNTLHRLREQRILDKVEITLQKNNLDDLLLYDWLSDGEQEFLGRMSLFHLLKGRNDALIILDEPETHFNDVWKRRVVDIIDDSLRNNASEVLISTHSSIALTDVFETEITLLRKNSLDGTIAVVRQPAINTFGASPSEIMRYIFDAPDTVGQRATEFLDMLLMAAAYPDDVEAIWRMDGSDENVKASAPFKALVGYMSKLPHDFGDTDERLLVMLRAIRTYTQNSLGRQAVTVTDALGVLTDRLGPGYYQFEFDRRLMVLSQR